MVVLIDGAAHGAEGVVAVGQGIGDGELPHAGGPGLLNDAHIGNIVAGHRVKANLQSLRIAGAAVGLENPPGQGAPPPLLPGDGGGCMENPLREKNAAVVQSNHLRNLLKSGIQTAQSTSARKCFYPGPAKRRPSSYRCPPDVPASPARPEKRPGSKLQPLFCGYYSTSAAVWKAVL